MPQDEQNPGDQRYILWRHTHHQRRHTTEGRNRPPPSIGSPAIVWHIGISRKHTHAKSLGPHLGVQNKFDEDERYTAQFYNEISDFLDRLQALGLSTNDVAQPLRLEPIPIEGRLNDVDDSETLRRFHVFLPQSLSFTLWWRDNAKNGKLNRSLSPEDSDQAHALRVFVQFQGFQEHISLTFYIDGAKRFSGKQIHKPEEGDLGERRSLLSRHLDNIRRQSYDEVISGAVESPDLGSYDGGSELEQAARYLFDEIWDEFQTAFAFGPRHATFGGGDRTFEEGVIFVNQRYLVMSMRGLNTEDDDRRSDLIKRLADKNDIKLRNEPLEDQTKWRPRERGASGTLGPVDVFDPVCGEPEVVLKSLWPFLCRMTGDADKKDWVGCGILDWRALLMSTIGAKAQPLNQDEVENTGNLHLQAPPPERFLIVTKDEPHRKQIGRFVERLISLETTRLLAFKNLGAIQNASLHLKILTMELDDILEQWSKRRESIKAQYIGDLRNAPPRAPRKRGVFSEASEEEMSAEERYYANLSKLNEEYETELIRIAARLEVVGPGGSGHLMHAIDDALYHIGEFDRMVPTLEIGNISGWINYGQFADRGMRPTFNMIRNTGQRLAAAQEGLKSLTDVVQVSALIVQSDATRRNTTELRHIAHNLQLLNRPWLTLRGWLGGLWWSVVILGGAAILYYNGAIPAAGKIIRALRDYFFPN